MPVLGSKNGVPCIYITTYCYLLSIFFKFLLIFLLLCLLSHYHRLSINLNIKKARPQTCF
nr:MAG TPA: hypothetical protein [Caudoviricetes sp.]DAY19535.1 MAG TPA: hypothetical protein [Caudoviricetes sp.]